MSRRLGRSLGPTALAPGTALATLTVVALATVVWSGCSMLLQLNEFAGSEQAGGGGAGGTSAGGGTGGVGGGTGGGAGAGGEPRPLCHWARSMGDGGVQNPLAISVVDVGSALAFAIGGQLEQSFDLEGTVEQGCPATGHPLTADGGGDAFVAVVDQAGCAVWSKVLAHDNGISVTSLANRGGELWLAGSLLGTTTLDTFTVGAGGQNVFWAALDATDLGAVTAAGTADLASLESGLVAAIPSQAVVASQTHEPNRDVLLQAVDGDYGWSWSLASAATDAPHVLVIEPSSRDIILAGEVGATGTADDCTLPPVTSVDAFVVRLNQNGSCDWAQTFGSASGEQRITAAAADGTTVVVAGTFTGAIDFGSGAPVPAAGGVDAFVAALAPNDGEVIWQLTSNGVGDEQLEGLALTSAGNLAVVGHFTGPLGFGTNVGSDDAESDGFLLLLDGAGQVRWHSTLHGIGIDAWWGVAAAQGRIVTVGSHRRQGAVEGFAFNVLPPGQRNLVLASFAE